MWELKEILIMALYRKKTKEYGHEPDFQHSTQVKFWRLTAAYDSESTCHTGRCLVFVIDNLLQILIGQLMYGDP